MRIYTAFLYFFKILLMGDKALAKDEPEVATVEQAPVESKPVFHVSTAPAIQVLALLQSEGRLIDFLQEDIAAYGDDDIGAAVRDIHAGCRGVLDKHFALERIMSEEEGCMVSVAADFDPSRIELQGEIKSGASLSGALLHGGWLASKVELPTVAEGADEKVVAPAQVEVGA
ncbi:uncharacterized protein DUF2760 [Sinobacterium caligoides]|uniref:Uncharacterized protein DUF2760 n=1 Tax=Sinobacterium caligoides TaxID=933926 RepID=A0A3N2DN30_9GAMM|nr:DUF2760 domain-containing protein [Sinobacterium caligoides]ROS01213.1 uncharacterized protein DUF2760 [Sinobacterium caligoides]